MRITNRLALLKTWLDSVAAGVSPAESDLLQPTGLPLQLGE